MGENEILGVVGGGEVKSEIATCFLEGNNSARVPRKVFHWWSWEGWVSARLGERLYDDGFELRGFVEEDLRNDAAVGMELGLEEQVTYLANGLVTADGGAELFGQDRGEDLVWMRVENVNIMVLE